MSDLPPDVRRALTHFGSGIRRRQCLDLAAEADRLGFPDVAAKARACADENELLHLLTEDPGGESR
jgi:hypothetical protein